MGKREMVVLLPLVMLAVILLVDNLTMIQDILMGIQLTDHSLSVILAFLAGAGLVVFLISTALSNK